VLTYLWIALGGALGSMARHWCATAITAATATGFPWGTMAVNIAGSFIIGLVAAVTGPDGRWLVPSDARSFMMVGILGGFTTFSSFSLQSLALAQEGEWLKAGGNVVGSVVLCLMAVWLGHVVAEAVNGR
jgi:CrcB protein